MKRPELSELTLRERIGQTAAVSPKVINSKKEPHEYLKKNPFGVMWTAGFVKMDFVNMSGELIDNDNIDYNIDKKIKNFKIEADQYMKVPFLPATDAEGGVGHIFPYFRDVPSQPGRGAARDLDLAYRAGVCIGESGRAAGTYWLWGPTADNASPFNSILCTRCFSSNPVLSSKLIEKTVKGMQSAGVAATLKHFPGADKHEYRDTHVSDMVIRDNFDTWYKRQGVIFEAGIRAGALSVMIQHTSFPAVDDTVISGKLIPATLSYKIITELLKNNMRFDGVVITDAVDMGSLTGMFSNREDFYAALYNAGNDVILGPTDENYIDIVESAVQKGKISEERINDACRRVLDMKEKLGMFDEIAAPTPDEVRREIRDRTIELNNEYAPHIITPIADKQGLLPVSKEKIKRVALVYFGYSEYALRQLRFMKEELEAHGAEAEIYDHFSLGVLLDINQRCDLIIYVSCIGPHSPLGFVGYYDEKLREMLAVFHVGREKSIVITIGSMFAHYDWFPSAETAFALYSSEEALLRGFVKGLYGECEFSGKPPYDPDPLAPRA